MFSQEEIKKLIQHDFSQDFKEVVFTQCGSSTPLIWRGPGTLSMSSSGHLNVKVFLTNEIDFAKALGHTFRRGAAPGTLLDDSGYYDMEATDYKGYKWFSKRFQLQENLFAQTSSGTVSAVLRGITQNQSIPPYANSNRHTMVFRGKSHVPFDQMIEQPGGGLSRSAFECTLGYGTKLKIRERDEYVVISIEHESKQIDDLTPRLVTEAVSIGSGQKLECIYQEHLGCNQSEISIWAPQTPVGHKESALWPPFDRHEPESFRAFVAGYIEFTKQTPNGFFNYWIKVYDAWQLGAFLSALPLSVYVEGMIAEFFPEHRSEPEDFRAEVNEVIALIERSSIRADVAKRCVGALGRIKEISTTQALKTLAGEGWFKADLIKAWGNIRHKSAHGHDITASSEDQQKIADNTFACLHLFYLLLLIRMRFKHEFRDLSVRGFPKIRLGTVIAS